MSNYFVTGAAGFIASRVIEFLIADGHTGREIAEMLVVSPKTVEWYKNSLMKKLSIHSRIELIKYAIRKRVITL